MIVAFQCGAIQGAVDLCAGVRRLGREDRAERRMNASASGGKGVVQRNTESGTYRHGPRPFEDLSSSEIRPASPSVCDAWAQRNPEHQSRPVAGRLDPLGGGALTGGLERHPLSGDHPVSSLVVQPRCGRTNDALERGTWTPRRSMGRDARRPPWTERRRSMA